MLALNGRRCCTSVINFNGRRCLSRFRVVEHVVPASYGRTYPGAVELGAEASLRLAVKQYIPNIRTEVSRTKNAVTIIGGHANGFPKEMYEPLWDDLYDRLASRGQRIESIWIADIAPQGESGRLNELSLGNDPNWWDHARDLLFLINQKQCEMSQPLMGIGHSMGGSILTALALLHPGLLQSLILIDPVVQTENPSKEFAPPSTYRRDQWPSYTAARDAFQKSKFYRAWDSRVLEQWLRKGLRVGCANSTTLELNQNPDIEALPSQETVLHDGLPEALDQLRLNDESPVTLVTTKAQEVFHYLRPLYKAKLASESLRQKIYPDVQYTDPEPGYEFYRPEPGEIFWQLPHLRPSVLYCFGQSSPLATSELRRKKLEVTGTGPGGSGGVAAGRVKEALFNTGHMLPFETPTACAQVAADWMDVEMDRWQASHAEWRMMWTNTKTKRSIDDEWLGRIPRPHRGPKLR